MPNNGKFTVYHLTAYIPHNTDLLSSTFIIVMKVFSLGIVHCLDNWSYMGSDGKFMLG
jgi:hypothetical protein